MDHANHVNLFSFETIEELNSMNKEVFEEFGGRGIKQMTKDKLLILWVSTPLVFNILMDIGMNFYPN